MTRRSPYLLVCLGLLAGCPSPTENDGGPMLPDASEPLDAGRDAGRPPRPDAGVDAGFVSVAIDDWCDTRALAECLRGIRCGRNDETVMADCLPTKKQYCDQTALSRGVAEGRIDYDPTAAAACLDAFGSGSCEEVPTSCTTLFQGKAQPDAGCLVVEDCDGTKGYCDIYDFTCPHKCRAWAEPTQRCDFYQKCNPGSGACEQVDAGVTACVPTRTIGQSCINYDSCGPGMYCTSGQCVAQRAGANEPCSLRNGFPYCDDELFCRINADNDGGTCQRKAGVGGGCFGYGSCLPSLTCSSTIGGGTCKPRAALGDVCSGYSECMDGLYCPPLTSRCARLPADGGNCSPNGGSSYSCAPGFACHSDFTLELYVCEPLLPLGAPCSSDTWCQSGDCVYDDLPDGGFGGSCVESCSRQADGGL